MTIADTDVLIDFLRNRGKVAARLALEIERRRLATTAVSRFELLSGVRTSRDETAVKQLLAAVPALPLDAAAADCAARVRKSLEARGEPIGMGDSLIAGIALANGGTLLTGNRRHFERVAGLSLAEI